MGSEKAKLNCKCCGLLNIVIDVKGLEMAAEEALPLYLSLPFWVCLLENRAWLGDHLWFSVVFIWHYYCQLCPCKALYSESKSIASIFTFFKLESYFVRMTLFNIVFWIFFVCFSFFPPHSLQLISKISASQAGGKSSVLGQDELGQLCSSGWSQATALRCCYTYYS